MVTRDGLTLLSLVLWCLCYCTPQENILSNSSVLKVLRDLTLSEWSFGGRSQ